MWCPELPQTGGESRVGAEAGGLLSWDFEIDGVDEKAVVDGHLGLNLIGLSRTSISSIFVWSYVL